MRIVPGVASWRSSGGVGLSMVPRAHTGSLGTPGMLRLFPVVAVREQIAVDRGASRLGARGTAPTTAQIIQAVLTLRSLTTTRANDTVVTRTKNIAVVVCIALPPVSATPPPTRPGRAWCSEIHAGHELSIDQRRKAVLPKPNPSPRRKRAKPSRPKTKNVPVRR